MNNISPWDNIPIPHSDFNVRLAETKTGSHCYWGRDSDSKYLFIIELNGDHTAQYIKNISVVKGIDIDLRSNMIGKQFLIFKLERQCDCDLFSSICHTLLSSLEHATNSESALTMSLAHIRRWKRFLTGNKETLSPEEIRGLFSEVFFLLEMIDRGISISVAIQAWCGPERSHQDFIFDNTSVEVKSISGTERNSISISSEDQLESINDAIFLRVYKLGSLSESLKAQSLNQLINTVLSKITTDEEIDKFESKLLNYGYVPLSFYDSPLFIVNGVINYKVNDEFPRLMRSKLPTGIANVSYNVKLEAIESFKCDDMDIFKDL